MGCQSCHPMLGMSEGADCPGMVLDAPQVQQNTRLQRTRMDPALLEAAGYGGGSAWLGTVALHKSLPHLLPFLPHPIFIFLLFR